jgi:CheY-like chemotaxis protein
VLRSSAVALVIADSFSATADDLFPPTADLRAAAGDTPVALLTGYPIEDDAARAAGFVGVIAKPFELEDLVARVRRWTRGGEA